jgi:DNA-directed RNA polymerase specialized sigma24 family protein
MAALEQRDRVALLKQALSALPEPLRAAILMRDIQEMSYQDIADQLHLPEGTVKSRINRGAPSWRGKSASFAATISSRPDPARHPNRAAHARELTDECPERSVRVRLDRARAQKRG